MVNRTYMQSYTSFYIYIHTYIHHYVPIISPWHPTIPCQEEEIHEPCEASGILAAFDSLQAEAGIMAEVMGKRGTKWWDLLDPHFGWTWSWNPSWNLSWTMMNYDELWTWSTFKGGNMPGNIQFWIRIILNDRCNSHPQAGGELDSWRSKVTMAYIMVKRRGKAKIRLRLMPPIWGPKLWPHV